MRGYALDHAGPGVDMNTLLAETTASETWSSYQNHRPSIIFSIFHYTAGFVEQATPSSTVQESAIAQLRTLMVRLKELVNGRRTYTLQSVARALTAGEILCCAYRYCLSLKHVLGKCTDGVMALKTGSPNGDIMNALIEMEAMLDTVKDAVPLLKTAKSILDHTGAYYFDKVKVWYATLPGACAYSLANIEGGSDPSVTDWVQINFNANLEDPNIVASIETTKSDVLKAITDLMTDVSWAPQVAQAAADLRKYAGLKFVKPDAMVDNLTNMRMLNQNALFAAKASLDATTGAIGFTSVNGTKFAAHFFNYNGDAKNNTFIDLVSEDESTVPFDVLAGVPLKVMGVTTTAAGVIAANAYGQLVFINNIAFAINDTDYFNGQSMLNMSFGSAEGEDYPQVLGMLAGFGLIGGYGAYVHVNDNNDGSQNVAVIDDRFYHHPIVSTEIEGKFAARYVDWYFEELRTLKAGKPDYNKNKK